jgi:mannose-6-phosphate isomerase-like protein (cupin superfamily)
MKTISVAGDRVTILLAGSETNNAYTIMEALLPPGGGPPPHVHHREDEGFLVMSGEVTFYLGEKTIQLKAGQYLLAPRKIPHHFKNTGATNAIVFENATPAGIERFFEAAGTPLQGRGDPPAPFTESHIAHLIAIAPEYGVDILVTGRAAKPNDPEQSHP